MNTNTKRLEGKTILNSVKTPSYLDEDLQAHIRESARSGTQYIIDTIDHHYRKKHGLSVASKDIRQSLRKKAYLMYAGYCEQMAQDLRIAAKKPEIRF